MKNDSGTAATGVGTPRRKSILAIIASLAMLAIGLVGIVAAPGASAHSADVSGVATCQSDGQYKIVWSIYNDYSTTATVETSNRAVVPVPTDITSKDTAQFTEYVAGDTNATITLTIHSKWKSDGYNRDNSGSVELKGTCTAESYTYKSQKTAKLTVCYNSDTKYDVSAQGDEISKTQDHPFTDEEKAAVDKQAQDSADAALKTKLDTQYPGWTEGVCKNSYTTPVHSSATVTVCIRGVNTVIGPFTATVTVPSEGTQTTPITDQQIADANEQAQEDADQQLADALEGLTPGACANTQTYSGNAEASGTTTVCTANGDVVISWKGTGHVDGYPTQAAATTAAESLATANAAQDKKNKIAASGGTEGACTPPTVTSPVVTPAAATVPAPAKKPAKPVAAPKPASVPAGYVGKVPANGTVPAAVPAGGGSSAPQQGVPGWAFLLMVAGAAGAAFSVKRLVSQR